jgi:hypothetical protein
MRSSDSGSGVSGYDSSPISINFCSARKKLRTSSLSSADMASATMDSCVLGSMPVAAASEPVSIGFSILSECKTSGGIICSKSLAEVGIGAGATINQTLQKDIRDVDEWKDKPAGIMRIYFVFREQFEKYAKEGFNDLIGCKSGYLEGLSVGGVK